MLVLAMQFSRTERRAINERVAQMATTAHIHPEQSSTGERARRGALAADPKDCAGGAGAHLHNRAVKSGNTVIRWCPGAVTSG